MGKKKEKIALLFLGGPSIKKYKDFIPSLVEIYNEQLDKDFLTMGVNQFPYQFVHAFNPKLSGKRKYTLPVNYWMFADVGFSQEVIGRHEGQKIITNANLGAEDLERLGQANIKPALLFKNSPTITMEDDEYLYGLYTTALKATHYLIKKGFSVVIFGMDNSNQENDTWEHFYEDIEIRPKTMDQIMEIKIQLNNLKEYGKIYKVDPTNNVDLDVVDLTALINKKIKVISNTPETVKTEILEVAVDTAEEPSIIESVPETPTDTLIVSLKSPSYLQDGTLFISGSSYDIIKGKVVVSQEHGEVLLTQGFKLYD
jgi:hypothetical protein